MSNINYSLKNSLILIVDDIPDNIQMLGNILIKENYKVSVATNGEKALNIVDKMLPDLILLDLLIPGMDGFEICERLKSNVKTKDIPIIFISVNSDKNNIVKALENGAIDYITKPFHTPELLAKIKTFISMKKTLDIYKNKINILEEKLANTKPLNSLLSICSYCKKVRNEAGKWQQLEIYIVEHTGVDFSHGICPDCLNKYFPEYSEENSGNEK